MYECWEYWICFYDGLMSGQQRASEWSKSFGGEGILYEFLVLFVLTDLAFSVAEVTGDTDLQLSLKYIAKAQIIITTVEIL